jgi:hypothetical protein
MVRLSAKAKVTPAGIKGSFPKVLVIAPPPIGKEYFNTEIGKSMGKNCDTKSLEMPSYLEDLLEPQGIEFLDTKEFVQMNTIDYMHLDLEGHKLLSKLVFNKIKSIL